MGRVRHRLVLQRRQGLQVRQRDGTGIGRPGLPLPEGHRLGQHGHGAPHQRGRPGIRHPGLHLRVGGTHHAVTHLRADRVHAAGVAEELDPLESIGTEEHQYEVSENRAILAPGFRVLDVLRYPGALEDALVAVLEVSGAAAPTLPPLGTFGLFFTFFLLFLRFIPLIAIAEVKGVTPQSDPHHPLGGAKVGGSH